MSATKTATPEILDILRRSYISEIGLTLPGQLERKSYEQVNKFLEAAGAKWNRKLQCHAFSGTAKADIEKLLETGEVTDKKQLFQQFYTPSDVARRLVEHADVGSGDVCLEPSAGLGAIAREMRYARGAVICVEVSLDSVKLLEDEKFTVIHGDFMNQTTESLGHIFNRVVMNPPFTKNQAYKHVLHAWKMLCSENGILVSVLPAGRPTGKALQAEWDQLIAEHGEFLEDLPEGTFQESGTNVRCRVLRLVK